MRRSLQKRKIRFAVQFGVAHRWAQQSRIFSVQKPLAVAELAKQPKPLPAGRLDAPIIAANTSTAPPTRLNPLRPRATGHLVGLAFQPKQNRRPIRGDRK